MTHALASMAEAARAAGMHYDTFRKGWRDLVRDLDFPAPVKATRPYRWRPAALSDWQVRREADNALRLRREAEAARDAANENGPAAQPPAAPVRRVDRERMAVLAMMQGAAS